MIEDRINWPAAGTYILAVSGGADSMTMLAFFAGAAARRSYRLIVAQFDHAMRADSAADTELVARAAEAYGLVFETARAETAPASEAAARAVRYRFLQDARDKYHADGIITAHHRDDLIETSLLNLARGSGRRGLVPMNQIGVLRPLLGLSRTDLRAEAAARSVAWNEDPTNADTANPRNFLRHHLLPLADEKWRARYETVMAELAVLNPAIDGELDKLLIRSPDDGACLKLDRAGLLRTSLIVIEAVIALAATDLDHHAQLSDRTVREIALFAKTGSSGQRRDLTARLTVLIKTSEVVIQLRR